MSSTEAALAGWHAWCVARVSMVLRELNLFESLDRVDPRARRLAESVLAVGLDEGLLKRSASGRLVPTAKLAMPAKYAEWLLEQRAVADFDPIGTRWLARCLDALPLVLTGALLPEEALFPRNDFELALGLYAESRVFSFFTSRALEAALRLKPAQVLELGSGTGAFAKPFIARAPGVGFQFTDVSALLVDRAKPHFGADRCAVLDLDSDAPWPGQAPDLVVALNVLHLSRDIDVALERIGQRLKPGGSLVLGEISAPDPSRPFALMELTFGQLPSFWARPAPLDTEDGWKTRLTKAGFRVVTFEPLEAGEGRNLGGVYVASRESR